MQILCQEGISCGSRTKDADGGVDVQTEGAPSPCRCYPITGLQLEMCKSKITRDFCMLDLPGMISSSPAEPAFLLIITRS